MIHMKIRTGVNVGKDLRESTQAGDQNLRTLMDFQNIETYFPKLKFPEHESTYSSFLKSKIDETDLLKWKSHFEWLFYCHFNVTDYWCES